jgi:ABC-2 type transport system permease protein
MTASATSVHSASAPRATYRTVGFSNVLRSEFTKLRSLRSTFLSTALAALAMVGIATFLGARWGHQARRLPPNFDATNVSLSGAYIAQIIVGALGVLAIASEYTTGMIRATFAAVPQRQAVLAAKTVAVGASTFVVGEVLSFASFAIGQALIARHYAGSSLADPGVLRAVFGAGLYLTAVALLGFGLGAIIRHTAGAIAAFFGVLFAPTAVIDLLPTAWRNDIINYLPANAGSQIFTIVRVKGGLPPWEGLGVFCLYAAAALVVAFVLVGVRDA